MPSSFSMTTITRQWRPRPFRASSSSGDGQFAKGCLGAQVGDVQPFIQIGPVQIMSRTFDQDTQHGAGSSQAHSRAAARRDWLAQKLPCVSLQALRKRASSASVLRLLRAGFAECIQQLSQLHRQLFGLDARVVLEHGQGLVAADRFSSRTSLRCWPSHSAEVGSRSITPDHALS